jgi:homoserine kinase type II
VTKVYVLQHVHSLQGGEEDVKFIGVYSSRENAQAAIARLGRAPGFADALDGFHIDEYPVDKDQWVDGYSTLAIA